MHFLTYNRLTMEIDRSKIPANKVYENYCPGVVTTIFLAFAMIGILVAFLLNITFSIFEFFGGIVTNSVAILSDSVHDWEKTHHEYSQTAVFSASGAVLSGTD